MCFVDFSIIVGCLVAGVPDLRGASDGGGARAAAGGELEARAAVRPPPRVQGDHYPFDSVGWLVLSD